MILHKKARLRDQRVVTQEMCGLSAARSSTKGNEKITFTDIQAGMTTTLSVFRFNPLFIQFSFPISLAPSAAAYLGTFSEIKGYYRFIALCRIFRIWNRFSTQKWWKKSEGLSRLWSSHVAVKVRKLFALLSSSRNFTSWWTIIKSTFQASRCSTAANHSRVMKGIHSFSLAARELFWRCIY